MRLIAQYKAHRGGEWFQRSLESIADHVDGVVVALSETSWDGNSLPNNCVETAERWETERPGWFRTTWVESTKSSDQVSAALAVIRKEYGTDTAVLVIDTDEVWEPAALVALRREIAEHPRAHYFCGRLYSYLRSPLYQVYPQEAGRPVVALRSAAEQDASNRFLVKNFGPTHICGDDVWFHHFTYVRQDEAEIAAKLSATASQEDAPSDPAWTANVWPNLPLGTNLHMTRGCEHCWPGIKILHAPPITLPRFCLEGINGREDARWRRRVESTPPETSLVPVPNKADAAKYPEFASIAPDVTLLRTRLKVSYLEALTLHWFAGRVPEGGRILEVGSGSGGSLACMALAGQAELWAVDPFEPYSETNCGPTVHGVREGNEAEFWETARHYSYAGRVKQIKQDSHTAAAQCPDGAFPLVFVDGNHTCGIVRKDLSLYWKKVAPGGTMLVHDYTTRFPGVIRAMQEWGQPYAVVAGTSIAYAHKP